MHPVKDRVGFRLWDEVWAKANERLRLRVYDQVRGPVLDQTEDQVGRQVWNSVEAELQDQKRKEDEPS